MSGASCWHWNLCMAENSVDHYPCISPLLYITTFVDHYFCKSLLLYITTFVCHCLYITTIVHHYCTFVYRSLCIPPHVEEVSLWGQSQFFGQIRSIEFFFFFFFVLFDRNMLFLCDCSRLKFNCYDTDCPDGWCWRIEKTHANTSHSRDYCAAYASALVSGFSLTT
jgi:hypothetical protein